MSIRVFETTRSSVSKRLKKTKIKRCRCRIRCRRAEEASLIRAVVDTNIVVSGLLFGGLPLKVINAAMDRRFVWVEHFLMSFLPL